MKDVRLEIRLDRSTSLILVGLAKLKVQSRERIIRTLIRDAAQETINKPRLKQAKEEVITNA